MSMPDAFRNLLCQAFTDNVDHVSLHTADPATTGANDSAIPHAAITWSSPTVGVSTATVEIDDVTGDYTHIGLWDGATFRMGIECEISYGAATDIEILLTHEEDEDEVS